ncbi:transcriptional regulator, MarR family [Paraburkholderia fungorum]|uniref:Transcriptional regulator, MarR family n=1 Tax=Paraburkholderia fungorum TaxID=134537 RepID=A0A1H1JZC4_9BURK|nr:transcriptional regulator, MarR family [Paraburkholderia fungorum]
MRERMLASKPKNASRKTALSIEESTHNGAPSSDVDNDRTDGAIFDDLYWRPGFMIRRAHQVASEIFINTCKEMDVTPSQNAVMFVLNQLGSADQASISKYTSLDRSTTALIVKILSERGFIEKRRDGDDRRKALITLTTKGLAAFTRSDELARSSATHLLAPLDSTERKALISLLGKLINHFDPPGC